jgi:hypothetical protein
VPATMSSVTTRGFGLSGGFVGSANLVVTQGYGFGAGDPTPAPPAAAARFGGAFRRAAPVRAVRRAETARSFRRPPS